MTDLVGAVRESLVAVSATEWVAVVLALGYLWLAIRQDPWCFAFAITSSASYLYLFADAGLYMQSALQAFFIAMSLYGWWSWRGGSGHAPASVRRWPAGRHVPAVAAIVALSVVNGQLLAGSKPSMVPYVDAAIAWGSVFTTWLVARKVLENWWYWIAIDLAACGLCYAQGLHATAALYLVYAALALQGHRRWARDAHRADHASVVA